MLALLLSLAMGQTEDAPRPKWGGIGLPYATANSTDGLGVGLGGELFRRPAGADSGYDLKFTLSTYFTVDLRYQSHFVQVEKYSTTTFLMQAGYQRWDNQVYAGVGGQDVQVLHPPDVEAGNLLSAPFAMVLVSRPVGDAKVYGQGFTRIAKVGPRPDGILDQRQPFGVDGGVFGQLALGVYQDKYDRWPLPTAGHSVELAALANLTVSPNGDLTPSGGYFAEVLGWHSPGRHLTFGGRVTMTNMVGDQPFFVQDLLPGRLKDELGLEQPLTGYARTRTRGDGVWAAAFEVRPYVGRVRKGFFDMALYGSAFAEEAFLFDGTDAGPHMPTVGAGVDLVWQGATVLRPFAAWGWRSEAGRARHPVPQFGLALKSPL